MTTPNQAWYLRCGAEDVGDRAVLVGDRGRVRVLADLLTDVRWLNEDRGLTTATGWYDERQVTVSAFGMGAPVATVVLDELAQLGVRSVLRLGTVMCRPPVRLGDLVLADAAYRGEATSTAYVPGGFPAAADAGLTADLSAALRASPLGWHQGLVATFDAFYPHMAPDLGARPQGGPPVDLDAIGALGVDMETSAILTVGRALGVRTASLCLATVDGVTLERMEPSAREKSEQALVEIGLQALALHDPGPGQRDRSEPETREGPVT